MSSKKEIAKNSFAHMVIGCYSTRMTTVPVGSNARFVLTAKDDAGVGHNASYSAQISDTAIGYIAKVGSGDIFMVAKAPGTVNIVISGTSQNGTALPVVTVEYTVPGGGGETQATHFETGDITVQANNVGTPPETPGVDTVTGSI